MTNETKKDELSSIPGGGCDVRIWSGSCEQSEPVGKADKFLCATCGTIPNLNHEVHHEIFPHVCGDEDNLS